jgi:hypothetical protein
MRVCHCACLLIIGPVQSTSSPISVQCEGKSNVIPKSAKKEGGGSRKDPTVCSCRHRNHQYILCVINVELLKCDPSNDKSALNYCY